MDLSKLDARVAIESRLATIKKQLTDFDKLTANAEKLEAELANLKDGEAAILKDQSRSDDAKLPDLLTVRGKIDLKQAAITALRGEPSRGNNTKPVLGKIEIVEQSLAKAGEDVSQFLKAYHDATLVNLQATIQEATSTFIVAADHDALWNLASHHPDVKQIHFFSPPVFAKHFQHGYKEVVVHARNLQAVWDNLADVADRIPGEMAVSIPDPWLE
jgi:hypothetical protein